MNKEREAFEQWYLEHHRITHMPSIYCPADALYGGAYTNTLWTGWQAAKAQAVPEWVNYELEKPKDGQKCLVVFESMDGDDSHRWMCIDEFNEGMFNFIANWEDECASVALPAGSVISKVRAVCWAETNLSNAPISFDQFYKAQEQSND